MGLPYAARQTGGAKLAGRQYQVLPSPPQEQVQQSRMHVSYDEPPSDTIHCGVHMGGLMEQVLSPPHAASSNVTQARVVGSDGSMKQTVSSVMFAPATQAAALVL